MFTKLLEALKATRRTIVFTEGPDARILEATDRLLKEDLMDVILIGNRQLSQKNKALETALVKLVPQLNSREHCRRFYKTVAPYLDPGGFVLYRSAAELTRFHISTEFATEDNMGKFEEMDGYGMLRYLTADRFGSVEYEIVAPCYEEAVSLHTDYTSPEYLAFEKKLYEKTLRKLGFGKLLPEERAPQKDMNKRKEKVEER